MCGIVGLYGEGNVAPAIHDALITLQHRGQDAAGIATWDGTTRLEKGEGLVRDVLTPARMGRLTGPLGIGHVRYPTVGHGGAEDAQPFCLQGSPGVSIVHNGNVSNYHALRDRLSVREGKPLRSGCDVEVILHLFADALAGRGDGPDAVFAAVATVFAEAQGSYSVVGFLEGGGLFAFRDPYGIKPIVFGSWDRKDGRGPTYGVASESVALEILGFPQGSWHDLAAGEAIFVDRDRKLRRRAVAEPNHHPCIFEHVYFARPDSVIDDVSVYKTRLRFGERLGERWKETGIPVDVVIPVPDSARPAATAMARVLDVPFREGFVKNRYIGRTFIMPGQEARQRSIRYKLNPIRLEFEGKDVLIVDDSIVRGNTSRRIVQMAREAGARKVYLASYSPPIRYPCLYGIDMATRGEFIARDHDIDAIRERIGADYLLYQSMEGLVDSAGRGNSRIRHFCTACFTGAYPTGDVTPEILDAWERDRGGGGDAGPAPKAADASA